MLWFLKLVSKHNQGLWQINLFILSMSPQMTISGLPEQCLLNDRLIWLKNGIFSQIKFLSYRKFLAIFFFTFLKTKKIHRAKILVLCLGKPMENLIFKQFSGQKISLFKLLYLSKPKVWSFTFWHPIFYPVFWVHSKFP